MLLKFETVDVLGVDFLRGADVVEDGAGGDGGGGMMVETEAFERADIKLALDERHGEVAGPNPVFNAGAGGNAFKLRGQLGARREAELRWGRL